MNKVFRLLLVLVFTSGCQTKTSPPVLGSMSQLSRNGYSIQYPHNWRVDSSHTMGVDVFIISPKENAGDKFVENVNVLLQNLPSDARDLDKYVALSEKQIKDLINDGELISSKRITKNGRSFQSISFYLTQGKLKIRADQYYFVISGVAYVVTFSMEKNREKDFSPIAIKILESFKLD